MFREKKFNPTTTDSSEIVDYSTGWGKFKLLLGRIQWQHAVIAISLLGFLAFAAIVAHRNSELEPILINDLRYIDTEIEHDPPGLQIKFQGSSDQNGSLFFGLTQPWWKESNVPIHLRARKAIVNAPQLIESLVGALNIESIDIEATAVLGKFSPVFLPNLKDFKYNFIGVDNLGFQFYREPENLKEILFFEKIQIPKSDNLTNSTSTSSSWDIKKDLVNLNVNVSVRIDGKKLVEINRPLGIIKLNVDYAWEALENVKGSYETLVLVSCPFATKPKSKQNLLTNEIYTYTIPTLIFPSSLKYLNMFNITKPLTVQVPVLLSDLLPKGGLSQLETLILYQSVLQVKSFDISVNLSELPSTLWKMSLRGIHLYCDNVIVKTMVKVTDLSLDSNNFSQNVVDGFQTIFANVKIIRLFNLMSQSQSDGQVLLGKVLKMKKIDTIFVSGFDWTGIESNGTGMGQAVKKTLLSYGIKIGIRDFQISKVNSTFYVGREINENEVKLERYMTMGFVDIETLEHYTVSL